MQTIGFSGVGSIDVWRGRPPRGVVGVARSCRCCVIVLLCHCWSLFYVIQVNGSLVRVCLQSLFTRDNSCIFVACVVCDWTGHLENCVLLSAVKFFGVNSEQAFRTVSIC